MDKDTLSRALEEALREEYRELTSGEIPDYQFSEQFEERMDKVLRRRRHRGVMRFLGAAAAAAVLIGVWSGLRTQPDIRHWDSGGGGIISQLPEVTGTSAPAEGTSAAVRTTEIRTSVAVTAVTSGASVTSAAASAASSSAGERTSPPVSTAGDVPRTTHAAASVTVPALTAPVTVATATSPAETAEVTTDMERLIQIQKTRTVYQAYSSAIVNTAPQSSFSEVNWPEEVFAAYDSGEYPSDIDMSGSFNYMDVFAMTYYYWALDTDPEGGVETFKSVYQDESAAEALIRIAQWYSGTDSPVLSYDALLDFGAYLYYKDSHLPSITYFRGQLPSYMDGVLADSPAVEVFDRLCEDVVAALPDGYHAGEGKYNSILLGIFLAIESGEVDADYNLDGSVTYSDAYELHMVLQYMQEGKTADDYDRRDIWEKCVECGDIDGNGSLIADDAWLFSYFELYRVERIPAVEVLRQEFLNSRSITEEELLSGSG